MNMQSWGRESVCYAQPSHMMRCLGSWAPAHLVPRPGSTVPWKNPVSHSGEDSHKVRIQSLAIRYSYSALPQVQAETALWFLFLCAMGEDDEVKHGFFSPIYPIP